MQNLPHAAAIQSGCLESSYYHPVSLGSLPELPLGLQDSAGRLGQARACGYKGLRYWLDRLDKLITLCRASLLRLAVTDSAQLPHHNNIESTYLFKVGGKSEDAVKPLLSTSD